MLKIFKILWVVQILGLILISLLAFTTHPGIALKIANYLFYLIFISVVFYIIYITYEK